METKIFSVYDEASEAYMMPFYSWQNASAIRAVVQQMQDPQSMLSLHPKDFSLYHMGSFNDQDGKIDAISPPILIGRLTDYLELAISTSMSGSTSPIARPEGNSDANSWIKESDPT